MTPRSPPLGETYGAPSRPPTDAAAAAEPPDSDDDGIDEAAEVIEGETVVANSTRRPSKRRMQDGAATASRVFRMLRTSTDRLSVMALREIRFGARSGTRHDVFKRTKDWRFNLVIRS